MFSLCSNCLPSGAPRGRPGEDPAALFPLTAFRQTAPPAALPRGRPAARLTSPEARHDHQPSPAPRAHRPGPQTPRRPSPQRSRHRTHRHHRRARLPRRVRSPAHQKRAHGHDPRPVVARSGINPPPAHPPGCPHQPRALCRARPPCWQPQPTHPPGQRRPPREYCRRPINPPERRSPSPAPGAHRREY